MGLNFNLKIIPILLIGLQSLIAEAQSFDNFEQKLKKENITIEMVAIKGGSFQMGAKDMDTSRKKDERPYHSVEVDDFWIGKYEITWDQYDAFVYGQFDTSQFEDPAKLKTMGIDGVTGATAPYVDMSFGMGKASFPAVNMTQYGAIMYCKWLTSKTGIFYRLPTEAEWEYVCKKGKTDESKIFQDYAWYDLNANQKYQETGSKEPNNLGVHDLLGNVSEWVLDQYSTSYYAKSPKKNPWNVPSKLYPRVIRGGSWKDTSTKLCCSSRQASKQKWKQRDPQIPKSLWWHTDAPNVGFRVIRPRVQPSKQEIEKYWLEAIVDYGMN